ncbi:MULTISPECIES: hypothetical protein [unclassified Streptomyces]|uniref:hypothetical protein n=1 Tax=Streptomyces sp. NPDC006678 TaxID=3157185 RepID=UPI0033E3C561
MSASEYEARSRPESRAEAEAESRMRPRPKPSSPASAFSMRDLLASCAAASAVSTPPREPVVPEERETRRDAA